MLNICAEYTAFLETVQKEFTVNIPKHMYRGRNLNYTAV